MSLIYNLKNLLKTPHSLSTVEKKINYLGEIPLMASISKSSDNGAPESMNDKSEVSKIFSKISNNVIKSLNELNEEEVEIEIED